MRFEKFGFGWVRHQTQDSSRTAFFLLKRYISWLPLRNKDSIPHKYNHRSDSIQVEEQNKTNSMKETKKGPRLDFPWHSNEGGKLLETMEQYCVLPFVQFVKWIYKESHCKDKVQSDFITMPVVVLRWSSLRSSFFSQGPDFHHPRWDKISATTGPSPTDSASHSHAPSSRGFPEGEAPTGTRLRFLLEPHRTAQTASHRHHDIIVREVQDTIYR